MRALKNILKGNFRDKDTSIFPNNHWGKVIRKMVCGEEFQGIA